MRKVNKKAKNIKHPGYNKSDQNRRSKQKREAEEGNHSKNDIGQLGGKDCGIVRRKGLWDEKKQMEKRMEVLLHGLVLQEPLFEPIIFIQLPKNIYLQRNDSNI